MSDPGFGGPGVDSSRSFPSSSMAHLPDEPTVSPSIEERFNRLRFKGTNLSDRRARHEQQISSINYMEASYSSPSLSNYSRPPSQPPPPPPSSATTHAHSTSSRSANPPPKIPNGPREYLVRTPIATAESNGYHESNYATSALELPSVPTSLPSLPASLPSRQDSFGGLRRSDNVNKLSSIKASSTKISRHPSYTPSPPPPSSLHSAPPPPKPISKSFHFPRVAEINPDMLATFLQEVPDQVLLLDVRPRDSFDEGHIYARNVVNIDPIILRPNQTGLELEDALVLSPSKEQTAFGNRHLFEMIVYYDQDSRTSNFIDGSTSNFQQLALQDLFNIIYEREPIKSLKRQPVLLIGGIDAWVDYCGRNSLVSSRTPSVQAKKSNGLRDHNFSGDAVTMSYEQEYSRKPQTSASPSPSMDLKTSRYQSASDTRALSQLPSTHYSYNPSSVTPRRTSSAVETKLDYPEMNFNRDMNDFFRRATATPQDLMPKRPTPVVDRVSYNGRVSSHSLPVAGTSLPPITSEKQHSELVRRSSQSLDAMASFSPSVNVTRNDNKQLAIGNNFSGLGEVSAGLTGLKNLGNTCYMNSIVQCLAGTSLLARFFLTGTYKKSINPNNKLGSKGELTFAFGNLVWSLYNDQCTFLVPTVMRGVVGKLNPEFSGNDQHDAQEFLTFILDGLHEDLNANGGKPRLPPPTEQEERVREKFTVRYASFLEWERYLKSDSSAIVDMFQGQYQSRLRCSVCGFTSTTYNPFSFLSLPIAPGRNVSLEQCFDMFVDEEVLEGDDAWLCPQCKKSQRAIKTLRISRLPIFLIIHLKRFKSSGRWTNKLDTFVDYPTHKLDLTKYWPDYRQEDKIWLDKYPQPADQRKPFVYNLYGVVNHYGSLKGGHYTAYVHKNNKGWLVFDDSRVAICPREKVVSRDGYVLFYERDMTKL
ncbi:hypothetical protein V1512DRAFT_265864 [Lipomyces arxii]|uniref:uncharacterized protein n=1 Tax=Lipomyces arxii TaxID=56418 RepID=UPI0034CE286B